MTLTAPLKRSITSDWKRCFEGMGVYKPMWLGRLIGPFFQGVCLERSSGNADYLPTSHIHCLCSDFPGVSLTLSQRLRSRRSDTTERISVQFHKGHFEEAAERLKMASVLPVAGSWGLRQLISAVDVYRGLGQLESIYPVFPFEDVVRAAVWLGDLDQASAAIAKFKSITSTWPENVLAQHGGHRAWIEGLHRMTQHPEVLRQSAESHVQTLKVAHLPRMEMLP